MPDKGLIGLFLLLLGLTIVVAMVVGIVISRTKFPIFASPSPVSSSIPIACPQDARQCPDGSFVSRQPPNCEFSPCP